MHRPRLTRRTLLRGALASGIGVLLMHCQTNAAQPYVQTVRGPIAPAELGRCLPHEHVMVDFSGAENVSPERYDANEVVERMEPYLREVAAQGVRSFIDCTPAFLARDARILRRLAERTGLHILTNTGWYKAPALPPRAYTNSPAQIAAEWLAEWQQGIEGTDIKPGFIKIAVNPGPLEEVQRTIVRAAALTQLQSGLPVASHTGEAQAAHESLDIIAAEGMRPARYIIVHADQIPAWADHEALLERGAWLEYDALGTRPLEADLALIRRALDAGFADQLLLSQDAGWYNVGQQNGGQVRPYTALYGEIIPALLEGGVSQETVQRLTVNNPARAFSVQPL